VSRSMMRVDSPVSVIVGPLRSEDTRSEDTHSAGHRERCEAIAPGEDMEIAAPLRPSRRTMPCPRDPIGSHPGPSTGFFRRKISRRKISRHASRMIDRL
jgi:hypothetical protein